MSTVDIVISPINYTNGSFGPFDGIVIALRSTFNSSVNGFYIIGESAFDVTVIDESTFERMKNVQGAVYTVGTLEKITAYVAALFKRFLDQDMSKVTERFVANGCYSYGTITAGPFEIKDNLLRKINDWKPRSPPNEMSRTGFVFT